MLGCLFFLRISNLERTLMPPTKWPAAPAKALRTAALALILVGSALAGPKYKVLHAFGAGKDGGGLWGSLVFDMKGNLYGTTSGGGLYGYGTVFQLTPRSDGKWAETLLHSFKNDDSDGDDLNGGLAFDAAGNLYGTTSAGGGPDTNGTVFEMKNRARAVGCST
jgi:uncharacterized repeat protein (TIGR03803 family)